MARRRNASYRGAQTVHFAALVLCEAPQAAQLFGHVVALTTRPRDAMRPAVLPTLQPPYLARHASVLSF